jgi:hypothetical protein
MPAGYMMAWALGKMDEYLKEDKPKLKIRWSCSDFTHHEHCYKWTAWLCGWMQRIF